MTPKVTKLLTEPEGPEGPKSQWKPLEASGSHWKPVKPMGRVRLGPGRHQVGRQTSSITGPSLAEVGDLRKQPTNELAEIPPQWIFTGSDVA